ncbi:hypothetical protein NQ317_019953 [Molorchus minor]|uniref:Uncharacterized protein n=1 Tax=Molorchus minor TaxID=1323400 RepID=A0ABQ9IUT6_9CUCU|nr:hypothetical protein NQ317_019953 [Molorchus minor]
MKKDNLENEEVNVYKVIVKLRQEKLLVKNEKSNIQELNESIRSKTQKIIQSAWITTKQRLLLCTTMRQECSKNYQKVDYILSSEFVPAKKALGFQNSIKVGNLLQVLRSQPLQLAKWLVTGEQMAEESQNYSLLLHSIVVGLYGCFIFPEDTKFMLTLLYELAKLQLLNNENPRSAALEMPIIHLMSCTDYYLDVDPEKTIMRYNQNENEIANVFKDVSEYRRAVVAKLVDFTDSFITSFLENVYSFPKSLSWIVCHISKIIEKSLGPKEANSIVTELIFTLYICPVIVDPEQYGICNAQVTDIARHNLIQVGQIIQSLALNKFEPTDPKCVDLFDLIEKNRVENFVELLFFDMDGEEPPIKTSPVIKRDTILFTEHELNNLISLLQRMHGSSKQNDNFVKDDESIEDQLLSLSLSRDNSPKSSRLASSEESTKNHITRSVSEEIKNPCNVVLVFPIDQPHSDPIGLLPEEKVLDLNVSIKDSKLFEPEATKISSSMPDTPNQNGDIKQPFSYQDEGSIGNTSDNLEAISEAASNHSVDSSIELENEDQNDNLSDMVSANVSGRGTPNISGRDTPSSQVCEHDDRVMAEARQADVAQPQQNLTRQIRSEIDDKFCKFEIKKLLEGDETISIISETWSTDVLASDNETIDAGESRHERQSLQLVDQAIQEVPIGNILDISETQSESAWSTDVMASDTERLTEIDNDDTVSVAQSDDTNSVARSDDTRSETDEIAGVRRLSTSSNSYAGNPPVASNQNYISTITVSSSTNYGTTSNNPFLPNGNVNNMTYSPDLPTLSTNSNASTTNYITSSNFQEYRKVDIKNDRINGKIYNHMEQVDNNANTVFKSLTLNNAEHSLTFSDCNAEIKSTVFCTSAINTIVNNRVQSFASKEPDLNVAGPSGFNNKTVKAVDAQIEFLKQNQNIKKYDDRSNEILLSNCSLNSSSSGSSSNSFENKNSHNENSEQWEGKPWLNSSGSSLNVTLTPSESTSELSVLSVNNINNPVNIINKKSVTLLNNKILKPSVSTGAIPKSISFDMSADKGLDDDSRSKRAGFFGKLRMGFKNKRGKSFRNPEDYRTYDDFGMSKKLTESPMKISNTDTSDDILAKYRTKPFEQESSPVKETCDERKSPKSRNIVTINSEEVNSFNDIKNKLRLVLSNVSEIPHYVKNDSVSVKNKIETVLRLELGKARKLREWSNVARISEAIRCINLLNDSNSLKLLKSMRDDIILRSTYIQYLITSKQLLLFSDKYLDSLQEQISHDKHQCEKYLATLCVKGFLSEQEAVILDFCDEFKQLGLADEKCVFHNREKTIKITLERYIMSRIYKNSIYPNGDGDRDRDRVLREHIEKLSKVITPYHKDLSIHKMYLRECPWLPAQDALRALNAYKTPRDKVKCIVHCAKCIMDLLALSQNNGSTTADDFTPVLVYVIIKVNPEAVLSTVQYVNSFFHNRLFGEEEYWWTQFCAAVEYIKTMDYSD